jgi:hypothetical protein
MYANNFVDSTKKIEYNYDREVGDSHGKVNLYVYKKRLEDVSIPYWMESSTDWTVIILD